MHYSNSVQSSRILFIASATAFVMSASASNAQSTNERTNDLSYQGRSVGEYVVGHGSIDPQKVLRSDFQDRLESRLHQVPIDRNISDQDSVTKGALDHPDDFYWDNQLSTAIGGIGIGGTGSEVRTATVYNGKLYVGGYFSIAGGTKANSIAVWDGTSWSEVGTGVNGAVYALIEYNGTLIAAGDFSSAGGVSAFGIASWDGVSWSSLGQGMGGQVYALAEYEGKLVAGGDLVLSNGFVATGVAEWDGVAWNSMGSNISSGVKALSVFEGSLIAGGGLSSLGGVVKWDGASWSTLGPGTDISVSALCVYDGELVAGGGGGGIPGENYYNVVSWDGSAWSPVTDGAYGSLYGLSSVYALTVFDGQLIAAGDIPWWFGETEIGDIIAWDGTTWSSIDSHLDSHVPVFALATYNSRLIVGGQFTMAGETDILNIASWDGSTWYMLGPGTSGSVFAIIEYDGNLIAGGAFTTIGGVSANHIAMWDGLFWYPLGLGMERDVYCLEVYNGNLIAGGAFTTIGGVPANHIAMWNGSSWSELGGGTSGSVWDMTVHNGQLIIGGVFRSAGGVLARDIAAWDGTSWSALGGLEEHEGSGSVVYTLAEYGGNLIAGGFFSISGGPDASAIASWDGSSWSPLGSGLSFPHDPIVWPIVYDIVCYADQLIVGGVFTRAGEVDVSHIAAWDGSLWSALGSGTNGPINAISTAGGSLIAGGDFSEVGGAVANDIAVWDGVAWKPLGSGLTGGPSYLSGCMALGWHNNELIVGGSFVEAGDKIAPYIASWTGSTSSFCGSFSGLFCDDFEDGPDPLWTTLTGSYPGSCTWEVSNGRYGTSQSGTERLCIQGVLDRGWTNYVYGVYVRGNTGVDKEITFRTQDGLNTYDLNLIGDPANVVDFNKVINGVSTNLISVPFNSNSGVWYHVEVACIDSTFVVYVDGSEILRYSDVDSPYLSGGIGLVNWTGLFGECDISFDNISVSYQPPHIVFTDVFGAEIGEYLTITGAIRYADGSVYTPLAPGVIGCEDPVSQMSRLIAVNESGSFSMTTNAPFDYPGLYDFRFGANYEGVIVSQDLFVPVSEPPDPIHPSARTGLEIGVGTTNSYPQTNRAIAVQNQPPSLVEFWAPLASEFYQTGKAAWRRTTTSPSGKLITSLKSQAFDDCEFSWTGWGACVIGAQFQAVQIAQAGNPVNVLRAGFDNVWAELMDAGYLSQQDVDFLGSTLDATEVIHGFWKVTESRQILDMVETAVDLADAVIVGAEVLVETVGLKSGEIEEIAVLVEDDEGSLYVVYVHPKWENMTRISSLCPVDLIVTNPAGLVVSKTVNEIPGAQYIEADFDNDGELEDQILIPDSAFGRYAIEVVPEPGAPDTATYSLMAENSYWTEGMILVDNEPISSIPPVPFEITTFDNQSPELFNLIGPQDTLYTRLSIAFDWTSTNDPDSGHTVLYDLMIAADSLFNDTIVLHDIIDPFCIYTDTLPTDTVDSLYFWRVRAHDIWGASTFSAQTYSFAVDIRCCVDRTGNVNYDPSDAVNLSDLTALVNHLFVTFQPIPCKAEANANGDQACGINLSDVTKLVNYLFVTFEPIAECGDFPESACGSAVR